VKGEITLLMGKAEEAPAQVSAESRVNLRQRVGEIMAAEMVDEKAALKKAAKERGVSKSAAYRELQRSRCDALLPRQLPLHDFTDHLALHAHASAGEAGHDVFHHRTHIFQAGRAHFCNHRLHTRVDLCLARGFR